MNNQKVANSVTLGNFSVTSQILEFYEKKHRLRIRFRIRPIAKTAYGYLLCRITLDGQRCKSDFTTGIKVEVKNWDSKVQKVKGANSKTINDQLDQFRKDLVYNFDQLKESGRTFGPDDLRKSYVEDVPRPVTLVEIGEMLIEAKQRKLEMKKLAPDTVRTQKDLQKRMVMVFEKTGWDWKLDDIRTRHLEELEIWVSNYKAWKPNTQSKTLKYFKEVIRYGMAEGLIPSRPLVLRVYTPPTTHKALTKEQLHELTLRTWSSQRIREVKDVFLFQCYTGLSYADVYQFNPELHLKVNSGKEIIELIRAKTPRGGAPYVAKVPLLPAAKRILEKYEYKLPILSNQKYNDHLKAIGEVLNLGFPLTSHVARKTFCTVLANLGVSIEIIAAWVGHATARETLKTYTRYSIDTMEASVQNLGFGT